MTYSFARVGPLRAASHAEEMSVLSSVFLRNDMKGQRRPGFEDGIGLELSSAIPERASTQASACFDVNVATSCPAPRDALPWSDGQPG